jgi:putative tryptophan/tyrosine transport system substrate-binding protein
MQQNLPQKPFLSSPILADDLESDPISSGFAASLAHPGRNIPGVFSDFPDFSMKWLQLLKEIIPALSRVRVLWDPATGSIQLDAVQAAGRLLNVKLTQRKVTRLPNWRGQARSKSQFSSGKLQGKARNYCAPRGSGADDGAK